MDDHVDFQFMSDIHLEYYKPNKLPKFKAIAPFLILAGDIGKVFPKGQYQVLKNFLIYCVYQWRVVIYVPGNHEYYGTSIHEGKRLLKQLCAEVLSVPEHSGKLRLLNPGITMIENIPIIGATLWSHIPEDRGALVDYMMNDFVKIREHSIANHNELFETEWETIRELIDKSFLQKKCLVVTHHAPDLNIARIRPSFDISTGYGTDLLDYLPEESSNKIAFWIYGHTHQNRDSVINGVHLVCNQKGYRSCPSPAFDMNKTISI